MGNLDLRLQASDLQSWSEQTEPAVLIVTQLLSLPM
jgi:hypothetical protein